MFNLLIRQLDGQTRVVHHGCSSISGQDLQCLVAETCFGAVERSPSVVILCGKTVLSTSCQIHADKSSRLFPTVTLVGRLLGGKGGFGSLLRGAGAQAQAKKTTNFDACRDMSGRRLRHVNAEKKIKEWQHEAEERNLEKAAESYIKGLSKEKKKKHVEVGSLDDLREESSAVMESMATAVKAVVGVKREGRGAGDVDVKGKRKMTAEEEEEEALQQRQPKKGKLLAALEEIDEDEDDSEEEEEDDEDDENTHSTHSAAAGGSSSMPGPSSRVECSDHHSDPSPGPSSSEGASSEDQPEGSPGRIGGPVATSAATEAQAEPAAAQGEAQETVRVKETAAELEVRSQAPAVGDADMAASGAELQKAVQEQPQKPQGHAEKEAEAPEKEGAANGAPLPVSQAAAGVAMKEHEAGPGAEPTGDAAEGVAQEGAAAPAAAAALSPHVGVAPGQLDLSLFSSAQELEALGLDRLKLELQALGLKCGGTLAERAARLLLLRDTPLGQLEGRHRAGGGQAGGKSGKAKGKK